MIINHEHRADAFWALHAQAGSPLGSRESWPSPLQTLVDVMLWSDQPMLVAWGEDLIALYNQAHAALIGDRHAATFGRPLFTVWNDVSDLVEAGFRDALAGRFSRVEGQWIPITRGGRRTSACFDLSYTPIQGGGGVAGVLCLSLETTAGVFDARRRATLLELFDRTRGVVDARAIVAAGVEALGRSLKANRVGYGEVQADGETILLETSYVNDAHPLHGLFPLESFGADSIAAQRRGETVAHDDVQKIPGEQTETWGAIETRAFVSAPLIRDGEFRASLYVNFREPHAWSPDEIALIEEIGDRIWDSLERARAEEALRSSEARFRGAVAAVQGVLWTNNAVGEMEGEQAGWEALTGQTMGEYQGYGWTGAVHPEDAGPTVDAWREAVEDRRPFLFEHRVRRRDGKWRTFSIRAIPILEAAGEIREWVGVHTDITEQRRAEEDLRRSNSALRRAQQSLSAIFGASQEGLTLCRLITDNSGRGVDYQVLDVNPAHGVLTGAPREGLLARPISRIAPPIDPRWIESADRAVRSGKPQMFEIRSSTTGRWLDIHVSPVGADLFAQTFIDVTMRHDAEEERKRLIDEMSHRVMNNFQMVAGMLDLQARRASSPEVRQQLRTAVGRVRSLSELHQGLATSRDSGEVDIRGYLTSVCDKLRATIDDPGRVVLTVSVCEARLDSAVAVPLGFIVNELVTNAIKYAFPEPEHGEIRVLFEQDEYGGHRLLVADGGKGMPDEADPQGAGLGMRLVNAFVSQIGATLEVRQGGGVTYDIRVPASDVARP